MVLGKWAVRVLRSSPPRNVKAVATSSATTMAGTTSFRRLMSAHLRNGWEVLDVGVEPRPVSERVGEDAVERRHQPQAVVEVVLVLVQHADDRVQVRQGRLEVGPALADKLGQ